ncbi:hypothetical protein [Sulfitobacter sediminis]
MERFDWSGPYRGLPRQQDGLDAVERRAAENAERRADFRAAS